jgi:hypothetical protein
VEELIGDVHPPEQLKAATSLTSHRAAYAGIFDGGMAALF